MKKRKLKKAMKRIRWESEDYLRKVGRKQRACKELVLESICFGAENLRYADFKLRDSEEFIKLIVDEHNRYEVGYGMSSRLKKDKDFIFQLMDIAHPFSSVILKGLDESIIGSREFIEEAYQEGYQVLDAATDDIRNDEDFIIHLVDRYDTAIYWSDLGNDLRARALKDRELLKRLVKASGTILCGIQSSEHKKLLADKEIILLAIQKDHYVFYLADISLYDDEEVILTMLLKYLETGTSSDFIQCASDRLKNDPTMILASESIEYCKMLLDTIRKEQKSASFCNRQESDSMCDGS